jgi:hypothetical protein
MARKGSTAQKNAIVQIYAPMQIGIALRLPPHSKRRVRQIWD